MIRAGEVVVPFGGSNLEVVRRIERQETQCKSPSPTAA
jgi:hypothetical protein